ncbi:MAG: Fur family transcriptional regulator [Anaerolineae bacterium]
MSCEKVFTEQLHARGFRLTPQREMVLSVLHDVEDFATAEEIYAQLSEMSASVNMSTVYRTLELLQELHLVVSIEPSDGQRRYELVGLHGPHCHLVCRDCGKVIGVDPEVIAPFAAQMHRAHGFEIELEHLSIPGLCEACARGTREGNHA